MTKRMQTNRNNDNDFPLFSSPPLSPFHPPEKCDKKLKEQKLREQKTATCVSSLMFVIALSQNRERKTKKERCSDNQFPSSIFQKRNCEEEFHRDIITNKKK